MSSPLRVIVVGLGHQSVDDHLPALKESDEFRIVAVCDLDLEKVASCSRKYNATPVTDLKSYLMSNHNEVDVALVAVPHHNYLPIIELLSSFKINIIKEKPFATSHDNAVQIAKAVRSNNIKLLLTLQRRYNPVFSSFSQLIKRIGKIHSIEARYVMNVAKLDEGWRASRLFSGGGALIDLGYHYVDLIVWYFGLPNTVNCQLSSGNREGQEYDVEDTTFVQFSYDRPGAVTGRILGSLVVSRVYPTKEEGMTAFGSRGHVSVQRGSVCRFYDDGQQERLERTGSWPSALIDQLERCSEILRDDKPGGAISTDYLKHVAFIEACYESARIGAPVDPHFHLKRLHEEIDAS